MMGVGERGSERVARWAWLTEGSSVAGCGGEMADGVAGMSRGGEMGVIGMRMGGRVARCAMVLRRCKMGVAGWRGCHVAARWVWRLAKVVSGVMGVRVARAARVHGHEGRRGGEGCARAWA
jgi:hypothetical protein